MNKKLSIIIFIVILITISLYKYMRISEEVAIQNLADKTLESVQVANNAILDTYMVVVQKDFFDIFKNEEVFKLLKKFKYATTQEQNLLRGKLYRMLYKEYDLLKTLNIRGFHFHTYDGKSLLRFHAPSKNGDSLIDFRTSIKVANTKFKVMVGFEGGRIYPGYRYVFPIIYQNDHLGSVGFSVSFEGIEKKFKNILPFYAHMIIYEKDIIYKKVFKKNREFFIDSILDKNYCTENYSISRITKNIQNDTFVNKLISSIKDTPNFTKKLNKKESFAVPIIENDNGYIITFLAIKNIDKQNAGYIVSFGKFQDIVELKNEYNHLIFIGFIITLFIYFLIAVVVIQVQNIKKESSKLQKFIDIQDSIVILTDGHDFKFANKKFFDFFGYRDLDDFLLEHHCICEHFIKIDDFFSLDDVQDKERNWIESLLNLSGRKRIVSMQNKDLINSAFSITINKYDEENYIINFSDISDTMHEKLHLQKQLVKDQLTNAYNRNYFDNNINKLIKLHNNKNEKTGIIFLDIDHFKNVNDTYGHQIGDEVLKTIVNIVKSNIRDEDKLIRWGGEEFIIILSANKIDNVYKNAEHLRLLIEAHNFKKVGKLTCSFGIVLHQNDSDINESIKKADEKLYESKNSGRNKVSL